MRSTLPFMPADDERLDIPALETWLWDAACVIRGAQDAVAPILEARHFAASASAG